MLLFLDSIFFKESTIKISEFFSTDWTSWEPVEQVLHVQPCFINALPSFDHSSPYRLGIKLRCFFLDSIFLGASIVKISDFLSTV